MTLSDQSVGEAVLDAEDAVAAEQRLAADGRVSLSLSAERSWSDGLRLSAEQGISVPLFCAELKALIEAGLNLPEALDTLNATATGTSTKEFTARLLGAVREGNRFSDALAAEVAVPKVLVGVIRGSEFTSGVAPALGRYLEYHSRLDELKNRVISASIYPAIVLVLGIAIVLFLLGYVVPRFSAIYSDYASGVGTGSRLVLAAGSLVSRYWPFVALGALVAGFLLVQLYRRLRAGLAELDRIRDAPVLGPALTELEAARIFDTLTMLIGGGFTVPAALRIGRDVALTARTRSAIDDIRAAVEQGSGLSNAVRRFGLGDEVAARLLAAGENSGDLTKPLTHIAEHFSRKFGRRVERAARVVEPALLLIVGATIGAIVLMMYLPIFDLAGNVR